VVKLLGLYWLVVNQPPVADVNQNNRAAAVAGKAK
jgi:hypothetical protein